MMKFKSFFESLAKRFSINWISGVSLDVYFDHIMIVAWNLIQNSKCKIQNYNSKLKIYGLSKRSTVILDHIQSFVALKVPNRPTRFYRDCPFLKPETRLPKPDY